MQQRGRATRGPAGGAARAVPRPADAPAAGRRGAAVARGALRVPDSGEPAVRARDDKPQRARAAAAWRARAGGARHQREQPLSAAPRRKDERRQRRGAALSCLVAAGRLLFAPAAARDVGGLEHDSLAARRDELAA